MLLSRLTLCALCAVVATAQAPCPDVTGATPAYVIGPLDLLEVRVWGNDKLSGMFPVRPDGMISIPILGEIGAAGMTVAQLQQTIVTKLSADVMFDPIVNIQVPKVNSKTFYIEGEVEHQGEFPLQRNLTVLDALTGAGGLREFARKNKIYVLRGTQRIKFDYNQVRRGQHMEQNIPVLNGDHIIVPEN
jgi:polysaccharide export outer membrane protein